MNFAHILGKYRDSWPEKTFIVDEKKRLTYRTFDERVNALAHGLLKRGVGKGDRVATFLFNQLECFEIFFAACKIGAVYVPLNYRLAPPEVVYIFNDSEAILLFSEEYFHDSLDKIRGQVPSVREYIAIDQEIPLDWNSCDEIIRENMGVQVPDVEVGLDHLQRIMYTSGTTAHPKGVMIAHFNVYWKNLAHIIEFGHTSDEVVLICGPLYHVGGMDCGGTTIMMLGGTLVVLRRFDPEEVLEAIEREKVTLMWAAPSMMRLLFQLPDFDQYDTSSLRNVITGAEKTPRPLLEESKRRLPQTHYWDVFGMTETTDGIVFLDQTTNPEKQGSVGLINKPILGAQLRVVNDSGEDVEPEKPGELILRGPNVFKGYWNNPKATAEAFKDGWFHTGDILQIDQDGYLYIIDRKKDMIISGGENISSLEVERVLEEHPTIKEVAVIGIPHEKWGETVKAYVVVKEGYTLIPEELMKLCEGKLARFKIPKVVEFIDALPRNPSGKVAKTKLRDWSKKEMFTK